MYASDNKRLIALILKDLEHIIIIPSTKIIRQLLQIAFLLMF